MRWSQTARRMRQAAVPSRLTSQVSLTEARLNQLQAYYGCKVAWPGIRQAIGHADEFVRQTCCSS